MALLRQSTAYTRMFLLVQSSDHVTGLTGATPTVNISKAGGTFAAAAGTISEVANGFYKIALTTADTGTLGDLAFHITATSADPTDFVDQVVVDLPGGSVSSVTGSVNSVTSGVTVTTNNDKAGYSLTETFPTNFSALAITAGGAVTAGTVSDKTGYALTTGEHTSISGDVWNATRASYVTAGSFGQGVASVQGNVTGSAGSVTGSVGSLADAGASLTSLGDTRIANLDAKVSTRAAPADILTTALTESYASLHAAPTLTQAVFEIRGLLAEKAVNSTTLTVKKIDGTTTAETFTLDSATAPTSITRAT